MRTELLNPQSPMNRKHLKLMLEKQQEREQFFMDHLELLHGMPPGVKRSARARSKRRSFLVAQLLELL